MSSIHRLVARARLSIAVLALVATIIDLGGAGFGRAIAVPAACTAYALVLLVADRRRLLGSKRMRLATISADVGAAALIVLVTGRATAPLAYVFFAFAVVTAGFLVRPRTSMVVTTLVVALYALLFWRMTPQPGLREPLLLAASLGAFGYLSAYLGAEIHRLSAAARRMAAMTERTAIASALHDGWCQALAGWRLQLETVRELLARRRYDEVASAVDDIQQGVTHEYDRLRAFVRALADVDGPPKSIAAGPDTMFSVEISVRGDATLVEHVLQMAREGVANVQAHARADTALISASQEGAALRMTIEDDGVGLDGCEVPWSIAARAQAVGGCARATQDDGVGTQVVIEVPGNRARR